jgi:hypothetical protein
MGVIDRTTHNVTRSCGASESQSLVQYGSVYGAGEWQSGKPFAAFDVRWGAGHPGSGPEILEAQCKACGGNAEINIS